jgi:hypothetical protein
MGKKKWFGLAAVGAAITAGVVVAAKKVKEGPDKASEMIGAAKSKVFRDTDEAGAHVEAIDTDAADKEVDI